MKQQEQPRREFDGLAELAETHSLFQLRVIFKASSRTLLKRMEELGIQRKQCRNVPPPADLAERAQEMGTVALRAHYKVGSAMLSTWLKSINFVRTGLTKAQAEYLASVRANPRTYSMPFKRMTGVIRDMPPMKLMERDGSLAGRAADYLRPRYRPVVKVEFTDAAKKYPKDHYMVGRVGVLSPDELVKLACKRSFKPDEWKQVAA